MTTQSQVTCPACGLPWVLIAGTFPLHTSKGEQCPMSNQEPASWPLPPDPVPQAIKEPGRKVRSDAGTKRGPRKRGGDAHVPDRNAGDSAAPGGPPSQEQERVVSSTFGPLITIPAASPSTTAISEAPASLPKVKPKRKPRSIPPVYLVLPGAPPSYTDYAEACSKAEEQAEHNPGTTPYLVWEARPKDSFEQGVLRTRLGRVRKARA